MNTCVQVASTSREIMRCANAVSFFICWKASIQSVRLREEGRREGERRVYSIHREIRMKYLWNCASHPLRYNESRGSTFEGMLHPPVGNLVFHRGGGGGYKSSRTRGTRNRSSNKFLNTAGSHRFANKSRKHADGNKITTLPDGDRGIPESVHVIADSRDRKRSHDFGTDFASICNSNKV